jgi:hypothetical protein
MNEMRELITVEAFNRALTWVCVAWAVVCMVVAAAGRRDRARAGRAVAWAALAPLVFALWKYYCWMVRVVPETGYVGLHKVRVFAVNLLVFVALGAVIGWAFGRLYRARGAGDET